MTLKHTQIPRMLCLKLNQRWSWAIPGVWTRSRTGRVTSGRIQGQGRTFPSLRRPPGSLRWMLHWGMASLTSSYTAWVCKWRQVPLCPQSRVSVPSVCQMRLPFGCQQSWTSCWLGCWTPTSSRGLSWPSRVHCLLFCPVWCAPTSWIRITMSFCVTLWMCFCRDTWRSVNHFQTLVRGGVLTFLGMA